MTGNFLQLTPRELDEFKSDPDSLEEKLFPEDGNMPENCCEVDKAWQGVHFLLAGDPWAGEGAAAKAVLGGTEIGEDLGYGPARYLSADEVKEVAAALEPIDRDELTERFDPDAMAKAEIYSFHRQDDDLEYYVSFFEELKKYYQDAAQRGNAMLLFLA